MRSAKLSVPLSGLRLYKALPGLIQASGLAGGFDLFCALESSAAQSSFGICQPSMSVCSRW